MTTDMRLWRRRFVELTESLYRLRGETPPAVDDAFDGSWQTTLNLRGIRFRLLHDDPMTRSGTFSCSAISARFRLKLPPICCRLPWNLIMHSLGKPQACGTTRVQHSRRSVHQFAHRHAAPVNQSLVAWRSIDVDPSLQPGSGRSTDHRMPRRPHSTRA
jgi:hypothetical protein